MKYVVKNVDNYPSESQKTTQSSVKDPRAVRQQNVAMSPVGLKSKTHCVGNGEQQ
jgi:hypothetical protein